MVSNSRVERLLVPENPANRNRATQKAAIRQQRIVLFTFLDLLVFTNRIDRYMGRNRNDESLYHGVVGFLDGSYFDFIFSPMNDYVLYYIINYIILIY